MNTALKDADAALPDFGVDQILLSLTVDVGGNVSLLGFGGIEASRSRSFEFVLSRKAR